MGSVAGKWRSKCVSMSVRPRTWQPCKSSNTQHLNSMLIPRGYWQRTLQSCSEIWRWGWMTLPTCVSMCGEMCQPPKCQRVTEWRVPSRTCTRGITACKEHQVLMQRPWQTCGCRAENLLLLRRVWILLRGLPEEARASFWTRLAQLEHVEWIGSECRISNRRWEAVQCNT